jgi:hypothetical protein
MKLIIDISFEIKNVPYSFVETLGVSVKTD